MIDREPATAVDAALTVFGRDSAAVASARGFVAGHLAATRVVDPPTVDDAVLIVSELVTNALRHGLGEVVVRTSVTGDGEVRISVTDSGDGHPTKLPADVHRAGGFGLVIVDRLATRWGVASFPGGKTVWATIAMQSPG